MGIREQNRAEVTERLLAAATAQLAQVGPHELSLRAVAREVGLVSSAVYRYFAGRDELLTAMVLRAYTAMGDAAAAGEAALPPSARRRYRVRFRAACRATRAWALAHPHEYALLYGTPVPGYAAPQDTVEPGTRVPLQLLAIVQDAHDAGRLDDGTAPPPSAALRRQLRALDLAADLGPRTAAAGFLVWTQLFGALTFELFGQLAGSLEPADAFFDHVVESCADLLGLP